MQECEVVRSREADGKNPEVTALPMDRPRDSVIATSEPDVLQYERRR